MQPVTLYLHFAWVVDDTKCIVVTRVCVSVRGRTPTLLHGPGCNLGAWKRLPPSCALLGGFAIGARVAFLWQHNANPSYNLASIPRYDDIVRTAGWAGSARAAGRWLAGDGGVLNITAAVWTAGFRWWHSGNKKRTQNVSEYMLVLALCLVLHSSGEDEIALLTLQESYSLSVLMYATPALTLRCRQMEELNACWNGVFRKKFGYSRFGSVKKLYMDWVDWMLNICLWYIKLNLYFTFIFIRKFPA